MKPLLLVSASLILAGPAAAAPPTLRIVELHPLVVAGKGFGASEQVRLAISGGNGERVVAADANGAFVARLGPVRMLRCAAFAVIAVGDDGSHASARRGRPVCLTSPPRAPAP
jgi:hypothetical protein